MYFLAPTTDFARLMKGHFLHRTKTKNSADVITNGHEAEWPKFLHHRRTTLNVHFFTRLETMPVMFVCITYTLTFTDLNYVLCSAFSTLQYFVSNLYKIVLM